MLVRPDPGDARGAASDGIPRSTMRLAANSGIQFIDVELAADVLDRPLGVFVEEPDDDRQGTTLLVVPPDCRVDDVVLHPFDFRPMPPERVLSLTGREALQPFLDQWLPLPYFRIHAALPGEAVAYDTGPLNWARLYIAPPPASDEPPGRLKLIVAFDTRTSGKSRLDCVPYLAPCREDIEREASFFLVADVVSLSSFLAEPWLEQWLKRSFVTHNGRQASFEHGHVASYLTLLQLLAGNADLPRVMIRDRASARHQSRPTAVDLVLDIGNQQTAALLVERDEGASFTVLEDAVTLKLRDLTTPTQWHDGPIATRVEFAEAPFGHPSLSRSSGRADAFAWPSLVRVGSEARRLANRAGAAPGVTGIDGLKARLSDTEANGTVWRFSREGRPGGRLGPMVSGEALTHLAEDGDLADASQQKLPAIRPRFSGSSTISLFVGELLLHALSQINAPPANDFGAPTPRLRELRRIVVSCSAGMPDEERMLLQERVGNAIDLVWRGLRYDGDADAPPRPRVLAGFDADLAAQLIFLFEELRSRFGGNVADFVSLVRKERPGRPLWPSLRIASVDLSDAYSNLAIVGYDVAADGGISAALESAERHAVAADGLVDAICRAHVVPALAARLAEAGAADAAPWLGGAVAPTGTDALFAASLESKVLRPAAAALKTFHLDSATGGAAGLYTFDLGGLVTRGNGRIDQIAGELAERVTAAGGVPFDAAATQITLRWRDLASTVRDTVRPLAQWLASAIATRDCDLVLLSGPVAPLPELAAEIQRLMPLSPRRFIDMCSLENSLLSMPAGAAAHGDPTWLAGAIGAYLASRNRFGADSFSLDTSRLATSTARPTLPAAQQPTEARSNGIASGAGTGTASGTGDGGRR